MANRRRKVHRFSKNFGVWPASFFPQRLEQRGHVRRLGARNRCRASKNALRQAPDEQCLPPAPHPRFRWRLGRQVFTGFGCFGSDQGCTGMPRTPIMPDHDCPLSRRKSPTPPDSGCKRPNPVVFCHFDSGEMREGHPQGGALVKNGGRAEIMHRSRPATPLPAEASRRRPEASAPARSRLPLCGKIRFLAIPFPVSPSQDAVAAISRGETPGRSFPQRRSGGLRLPKTGFFRTWKGPEAARSERGRRRRPLAQRRPVEEDGSRSRPTACEIPGRRKPFLLPRHPVVRRIGTSAVLLPR